ncbi:hypothetical protein ACWIGI_41160 [Nocardia sp. NPDC055321]
MATSPYTPAEHIRKELARRLAVWSAALDDDIAELDSFGLRRSHRIRARSILDPQLGVVAEVGGRPVQDFGTFDGSGPVHMLSVLVAVDAPVVGAGVSNAVLSYGEAVAWLTVLLPRIDHFYLSEGPDADPDEPSPHWLFSCFLDSTGQTLAVPVDFDWVSFRIRYRGLRVSMIDREGTRVETVYRNPRFADFYQPRSESRGRYWPLAVTRPPEGAGIGSCFEALATAVARRTAIAPDTEPLSLTWIHGTSAALVVRHIGEQRCYELIVEIPTDDEIAGGTYILAGTLGDLSAVLRSPAQYAAGAVARLRDAGIEGMRCNGNEIDCPKFTST